MVFRLYEKIIHELKKVDYRSYRQTNNALSHLSMIPNVDLASYVISCVKGFDIYR